MVLALGCQKPAAAQSLAATSPPSLVTAVDVSPLVAKVKGSVVNITVETERRVARGDVPESPFDFFFRGAPNGRSGPPGAGKQRGLGTGFLVDGKGHVLTNAHVVDGADTVKVKLADEREMKAKVKGRDERLDIAVLELESPPNLPHVPLGSSESLKVGESVVAIGNPFGLGHTVTMGIVSAKGRAIGAGPYDDFIQTDASINPGNSGGPLFNVRGEVVGMNTAINPSGQGIGFAIPSDELRRVLEPLLAAGHVERGQLGVRIQDVDEKIASAMSLEGTRGALVGEVVDGSAAAKAGLKPGDVIVAVDGTPVPHARDLSRAVGQRAPKKTVKLDVVRSGAKLTVSVVLDKLQEEKTASTAAERGPAPASVGSLGIDVTDADGGGARIRRVAPGSPAEGAVRPGDVVVELNKKRVASATDLAEGMRAAPTGKPVLLMVRRDGSTRYVAIERS